MTGLQLRTKNFHGAGAAYNMYRTLFGVWSNMDALHIWVFVRIHHDCIVYRWNECNCNDMQKILCLYTFCFHATRPTLHQNQSPYLYLNILIQRKSRRVLRVFAYLRYVCSLLNRSADLCIAFNITGGALPAFRASSQRNPQRHHR